MLQYKSLQQAERFLSLQRNHFATLPPSELFLPASLERLAPDLRDFVAVFLSRPLF